MTWEEGYQPCHLGIACFGVDDENAWMVVIEPESGPPSTYTLGVFVRPLAEDEDPPWIFVREETAKPGTLSTVMERIKQNPA